MEKNANYALVGIATMVLFAGLIVFVIRIAGKSAMRREQFMYR